MARRSETMDGILVAERCVYTSLKAVGVGATDSTYTEAGPRPGLPVYSDTRSVMQLVVSQAQAESLTFEVRHSGQPSRDGLQLQYRPTDESVSCGWETPSMITGWLPLGSSDWGNQDASSSAICVVPSVQYVVTAVYDTATAEVVVTLFAPGESALTFQTGFALDASWGDGIALTTLPDERVLLFLGRKVYYTDDYGSNWALYSEGIITDSVATYGRATVVQYRGDLLMLVEDDTTANTVYQYASTDGGASFSLVGTYAGLGRRIDACANEDGIHITWTLSTSTSTRYRRLAHVHEELDQTTATVISNGGTQSFIVSDGGGTLWIGYNSTTTTGRTFMVSSVDSGETWNSHAAGCYYSDNAADELFYLHAVWQCGRIVLLHGYDDGGTPYTGAGVMWLGGWSSAVGAVDDDYQHDYTYRPGWTSRTGTSNSDGGSYLPWTSPANVGWTGSGGAGTPAINAIGALSLTTVANEISYSQAPANMSGSVLFRIRVRVSAGGSLTTQAVALVARVANGVYDYEIAIQMTTTGFRVLDVNGAATLADATVTMSSTGYVDIMGWLDNAGGCKIARRTPGTRLWTTVYSGTGVTNDGATPNANGILRWGNIAAGTATSFWREVHWTIGTGTEYPRLSLVASTAWGKPINARPEPLPEVDDNGLVSCLSVIAGPGRYGESVVVAPAYEYSIRHACAEEVPSPRTRWRSTSTAEQSAVFDLGANGHTGQAVGLFVTGANFRTIYLENYVGGAWVTRATLDLATGFTGLTPVLSGDVVYPNTSTTAAASRWLWEQELRDGWVKGTSGATAGARVTSQTSGGWATTGSVIPVLTVSDGTLLTGTTQCALVSHTGLVVWYPSTFATSIARYWRWRIPAGTGGDDTPDGELYYEAGAIILGRLQPFGAAWSWGRSADAALRVDRFVDASGAARQRKRGPVARQWTAGWPDEQTHIDIRSSLACDHVGAASAFGLAAHHDVSQLVAGLLDVADGGARPVVAITQLPADGVTITDRTRYLYGHITSDLRATQPLGTDVGTDDVWRTGEITISEAV